MLHCKPNNWEIFKIPPVLPIQYYSILKRKREFSQLVKQYDAQVRKHGYLHYCSIVPKSISSSLRDEYELLIVFFGDVPSTSFIGFRVNVNCETFIHESNSLLLFLKQSKKAGLYFVNNNCIHVQCGKDAWEIFYHLYGIYLRKYVLTVIGTQFFNHFVYQLCLQNEKQLLNLLFRGSKVIRVSKMSIYYRLHPKRKISVTDLIRMTLNMPERNFHSEFVSQEFKTHKENKENKQLIANSSVQKRKFEETENEFQFDSFLPKFPKISDSNCFKEESCWEQYTSLKPYPIKSYSRLLHSKSIVPDLFDNSKSSREVDSLANLYCNNFFPSVHSSKSPSVFLVKKCQNSPTVEETCDVYNVQNLKTDSQLDGNFINAPCFRKKKLLNYCKKNTYATNDSPESRPNTQMHHQENISLQSLSFPKSTSAVRPSKHIDQGEATHADEMLTTAAGKSINISNNAMLAAQRFIQGMFQDETHPKLDRDAHCCPVENKQFIKVPALRNNSMIFCSAKNSKNDEITLGEIDSTSTNNNYELGVSYDRDNVSFHTAAGKMINVSKAAMKAAHKLIQDAFENEDIMSSSSGTFNTHNKNQAFKDIGGQPKKLLIEDNDDTMDQTLVEKFFLDAVFDEKESEDFTELRKEKDESEKKNEPKTRKIKKSLGGRRKFHSDT